ncbi:hypothetical protein [Actinoplanes sp. NPDC049265]|uniref:hypothetical protein n=1 Tax=Actinoplanes sp. NPDC049265 TaxID=3363902 RepID=UPI003724BBDC
MTNWMTAAGLALIAGGVATLIGFRHVLLGRVEPAPRGERRRGGSPVTVRSQIRARRRRQALAALPAAPTRAAIEAPPAAALPPTPANQPSAPVSTPPDQPSFRAGDSKRVADLPSFWGDEPKHAAVLPSFPADEPKHAADAPVTRSGKAGRRASRARTFTSRAKDLDGPTQSVKTRFAPRGIVDEPTSAVAAVPPTPPDRKRPAREGDRIEGWVRPEYEDEEPAAGDYWMPVPEQSYGWPTPLQRLPEAPPYPSSRFDPIGEPEPTGPLRFGPPAEETRPTFDASRLGSDAVRPGSDVSRTSSDVSRSSLHGVRPGPLGENPPNVESETAAEPEPSPESSAETRTDSRPEPTGVAPPWPPAQPSGRVELPPTWSARNVQQRPVRGSAEPAGAEPENPPRPRPRPRPRPSTGAQPERSTVYRSRHAADPS